MKRLSPLLLLLGSLFVPISARASEPAPAVAELIRASDLNPVAKARAAQAVSKLLNHPRVQTLKLTRAELECAAAHLFTIALHAMIDPRLPPASQGSVAGYTPTVKRLSDARKKWCDDEGGGGAQQRLARALYENDILLEVPDVVLVPDTEQRVTSASGVELLRAFATLGVAVNGAARTVMAGTLFPGIFTPEILRAPHTPPDPRAVY